MDWKTEKLSDVCAEITTGGAAPQGDAFFSADGVPFVRVYDMGQLNSEKYIVKTKDSVNEKGAARLRLFPAGTVLFTKSGASLLLNQRAILKTPMYVVSHIGCLIPNEQVITKWLYYWMKTIDFGKYAHATTLPSLKLTTLKDITIPVPSLAEQERIVSRIEELFSQLDAGVETLKKTKAQLAVYRQAVLKEAFEKEIEKYPYKEYPLKDLVVKDSGLRRGPFGGAIKKSCFVPSGYKVYEQGNAINNTVLYGKYYISEQKYQEMQSFSVLPHDLLVSCSGTLGRITELPDDAPAGIINQALLRIRLNRDLVSTNYFIEYFRSGIFQKRIVEKSQGSAMVNLVSIREFKEIKLNIPEMQYQPLLLSFISEKLSVCDSIEQTVDAALQQANALRQSILKQAFEGGL